MRPFQSNARLPCDTLANLKGADILIMGMGRVGSGAYDAMNDAYGIRVCGIDSDTRQVTRLQQAGRNVILGDAEDADFWEEVEQATLKLVMLAMPTLGDMVQTVTRLPKIGDHGPITAVAKYEDERSQL
ncbi:MAG: NAD-binding protein [Motiliproteus sp.]